MFTISNVSIIKELSLSLQVNPFKDRICKVFSSSKDGELTFEDFLDMMSVFSENVSLKLDCVAFLWSTLQCTAVCQCHVDQCLIRH